MTQMRGKHRILYIFYMKRTRKTIINGYTREQRALNSLFGPCEKAGYPMERRYELECYIEFDEDEVE